MSQEKAPGTSLNRALARLEEAIAVFERYEQRLTYYHVSLAVSATRILRRLSESEQDGKQEGTLVHQIGLQSDDIYVRLVSFVPRLLGEHVSSLRKRQTLTGLLKDLRSKARQWESHVLSPQENEDQTEASR